MPKILLNSKKSKSSTNRRSFISTKLERSGRLLPFENMTNIIDEYKQYLKEKEASKKYRLSFTINPLCTNILFNNISEIVYKEGSNECKYFGLNGGTINEIQGIKDYLSYKGISVNDDTKVTRQDLIRDTGFTHSEIGPLVYHCGYDIFNNHTLRKKEFNVVNKINTNIKNDKRSNFNTISDYRRDSDGRIIEETLGRPTSGVKVESVKVEMHQYHLSNILTFSESINENLAEENGWIGFINKTTLNIPNYIHNGYEISLNKTMNNNKHGEFIDMYPDRSLYSFIPKVNKYRNNRVEPNWDYCLTYPYDTFDDNDLVRYKCDEENNKFIINGLSCSLIEGDEKINNEKLSNIIDDYENDDIILTLKTKIPNNIEELSKIEITVIGTIDGKKTYETIDEYVTVDSVDKKNNTFSFRGEELKDTLFHFVVENDDETINVNLDDIRVRQVKNGIPCKYYFRRFKKINGGNINSVINKMGFSKNIYSDDIAQLLFNDDVNLDEIRDNLGRELSEIYLTIIKNNKGYKEWYENKTYGNENVTFSHCFGKVTSGVDINDVDEYDYNIHKIHNVPTEINDVDYDVIKERGGAFSFLEDIFKTVGKEDEESVSYKVLPLTLEDNITIEKDIFLGDIVEFSISQVNETVLTDVKHRFNTVQREYYKTTKNNEGEIVVNKEFYDLLIDEIYYDDYDITMYGKSNNDANLKFKLMDGGCKCEFKGGKIEIIKDADDEAIIEPNKFNAICDVIKMDEKDVRRELISLPINIAPEGYYYQAHHRIPLKEYREGVLQGKHEEVFLTDEYEVVSFDNNNTKVKTKTNVFSYLERLGNNKDKLWLYDSYNNFKKIEVTLENIGKYPSTEVTINFNKPINDVLNKVSFDLEVKSVVNEEINMPSSTSEDKVLIGKIFGGYRIGEIVSKGEVIDTISSVKGVKVDGEKIRCYTLINNRLYEHATDEYGEPSETYERLKDRYTLFKPTLNMPSNSVELEDGTGRYLWREFKEEHEYEVENGEINKYVFTNGAHYINKNINFFLRRQDPDGRYGLSNTKVNIPFVSNLAIDGYSIDNSAIEHYEIDEEGFVC